MARKQVAGLLVSGWVGQLRIDGGVLDIDMAQAVFDKGKISAGVYEMGGKRWAVTDTALGQETKE
jgi:hypothetical protein